jgi:hypothetical protein
MQQYLVTAKHVIDGIRSIPSQDTVYIHVNDKLGKVARFEYPLDAWQSDPDDAYLDIAVIPVKLDYRKYRWTLLAPAMLATDELIKQKEIGAGSNVYMVGLFSYFSGTKRISPIVRTGHIAAMPEEPVRISYHGDLVSIDAYLVEATSIGGVSGSPVFVRPDNSNETYLLGLVHGHWNGSLGSTSIDTSPTGLGKVQNAQFLSESVNTGIAIVVPAKYIESVLVHAAPENDDLVLSVPQR